MLPCGLKRPNYESPRWLRRYDRQPGSAPHQIKLTRRKDSEIGAGSGISRPRHAGYVHSPDEFRSLGAAPRQVPTQLVLFTSFDVSLEERKGISLFRTKAKACPSFCPLCEEVDGTAYGKELLRRIIFNLHWLV